MVWASNGLPVAGWFVQRAIDADLLGYPCTLAIVLDITGRYTHKRMPASVVDWFAAALERAREGACACAQCPLKLVLPSVII